MAHVIAQIGEDSVLQTPAVVGLAEIENEYVLRDLVKQPVLKKKGFDYILHEGPDMRGIDVALLYRKDIFRPIYSASHRLIIDSSDLRTRDQLVVGGVMDDDTLYIIVNHWPSRVGGQEKSAPNRAAAANLTKRITNDLLAVNPAAKILVMGDLNDDPADSSVAVVLNALALSARTPKSPQNLFNPAADVLQPDSVGTLEYRGKWNLFDQIIVSKGLLDASSKLRYEKFAIFKRPFLLQNEGNRYDGTPLRTFGGKRYLNGYSDHLPTYVILRSDKPNKR
jgi:hypothetical protein